MRGFLYIITLVCLISCKFSTKEETDENPKIIAVAGNESLNWDEYTENYLSAGIVKDSAFYAKKTIEMWATNSLFYQEAMDKLNAEELQIDKQVESYKKSLVTYIYQTKIIEANLDTVITKQEIENYYNARRDNFILKENIIKVDYLKIPNKAPTLEKIKKLLKSPNLKDKEQLKELYMQAAENFFMNDSTWLYLEDIKKEIPTLRDQPDFNLSTGKIIELTDDYYYYYLKVKDVKVKNALSPINFEQQNIRKFIINNRKTQIINDYRQILLEKAKNSKSFTINE